MKNKKYQIPFVVGCIVFKTLLCTTTAKAAEQGAPNTNTSPLTTNNSIVSRGANQRVWQKAIPFATNEQGQISYHTNSYTELATGLHHLVGTNWVESIPAIQITAGGGAATNGQHRVIFAANINASNAVETITPDGKSLDAAGSFVNKRG